MLLLFSHVLRPPQSPPPGVEQLRQNFRAVQNGDALIARGHHFRILPGGNGAGINDTVYAINIGAFMAKINGSAQLC